MVVVGMSPMPLKVIRIKVCSWAKLKAFLGYQKILDPKNTHTLERRRSKRNQWILWRWKEVCIVIDIMAVAQNNVLKCKGYLNITRSNEKVNMPNILWQGIFDEGWCEWWNTQWNSQNFHSFLWGVKLEWGVKIRWQIKEGPCYTFLRLDRKIYCTKFGLEMFICRWYNWGGLMMWMSSVMDGNR